MLNKIKVCYFINGFVNGGVESVIYNYIKHIDKKKFDMQIISWNIIKDKKAYQKFLDMKIKVYLITLWKENFVKSWKEAEKIFRSEKYDIIQAHVNDLNWIPLWQAFLCKIPVRISHSHMAYPMSELSLKNRFLYFIERQLGRIALTDCFACSKEALKLIVTNTRQKNIYIMRNAIEINHFLYSPEKRELVRKAMGIENEIVIGHIGRFERQKNHKFLLEVYYEFQKKCPHSKLLLVGIGKLEQEIRRQAEEQGIEKSIIFYGTTNKVEDLYNAMDIMVFPSLWEGLGLVCIEAEINGLPVLASNHVPLEVKISQKLNFFNLTLGSKKWAEEIMKIINDEKMDRGNCDKNSFQSTGYDIVQEVKKLEKKYISLLKQGEEHRWEI